MQIEELRAKKAKLENDIRALIKYFNDETKITVKSVDASFIRAEFSASTKQRSYILARVDVTLEDV